jgi:hypothetical protein
MSRLQAKGGRVLRVRAPLPARPRQAVRVPLAGPARGLRPPPPPTGLPVGPRPLREVPAWLDRVPFVLALVFLGFVWLALAWL